LVTGKWRSVIVWCDVVAAAVQEERRGEERRGKRH
jgi:hypothetical protein